MASLNYSEKFDSQLHCSEIPQKVFSVGDLIYSLVRYELWSFMGMVQKLLCLVAPHWLRTLLVDWGGGCVTQFTMAQEEDLAVDTWPKRVATTARVGHKMHENKA